MVWEAFIYAKAMKILTNTLSPHCLLDSTFLFFQGPQTLFDQSQLFKVMLNFRISMTWESYFFL